MQQASKLESDRRRLLEARERGPLATLGAYLRMSGPGWLQSALTLGGGSLASLVASMVWAMPQYSLAVGVAQ